ncbi:hypothetical protein QBC34DRAFT_483549 [Podospora aff. communis PSN243]|uniref:MYND-type domain-containing protein n=1 Tax=Podospora aff. communis PSN243 TaxID=3040156 RepID=A0AAV9GWT1_9PEZI|nr:hypothetical protein QBC34DRAFT_483549 [Podospora aff. communis PSN243]
MGGLTVCTICSSTSARLCTGCSSAGYCSTECQETDWPVHQKICRSFKKCTQTSRPSPHHHLAIYFPMGRDTPHYPRPRAVWVDSQEEYIGRNVITVGGNALRGCKENPDTLNIWILDDARVADKLVSNQCLHSHGSALCKDAWGDKFWKGPIVAVLKVGATYDPPRLTDMTLNAYRDTIDYLGYYRDTIGSIINGPGATSHWGKLMLDGIGHKVRGVRINCPTDQASRREMEMVSVQIPQLFGGMSWVTKEYRQAPGASSVSRAVVLLRLRTTVKDGRWAALSHDANDPTNGSILVVNRSGRDLNPADVRAMSTMIQQKIAPLMTDELAQDPNGEETLSDAIGRMSW